MLFLQSEEVKQGARRTSNRESPFVCVNNPPLEAPCHMLLKSSEFEFEFVFHPKSDHKLPLGQFISVDMWHVDNAGGNTIPSEG